VASAVVALSLATKAFASRSRIGIGHWSPWKKERPALGSGPKAQPKLSWEVRSPHHHGVVAQEQCCNSGRWAGCTSCGRNLSGAVEQGLKLDTTGRANFFSSRFRRWRSWRSCTPCRVLEGCSVPAPARGALKPALCGPRGSLLREGSARSTRICCRA
jgi:hypothetical protein